MNKGKKAQLILENGIRFEGNLVGFQSTTVGEVIFCTSMVGYQELITDPSMAGKIIIMTYPLIGNYGIILDDMESDTTGVKGFIVRELSDYPSNWRCELELDTYLEENEIVGLEGVDTRALTKVIRNNGSMKGIITADELSEEEIAIKFATFNLKNTVKQETTKEKYVVEGSGSHIAFLDLGTKRSVVNEFKNLGCKVTVFPAYTTAEEILNENADGLFVSNGPGNPNDLPEIIETVKTLKDKMPVFGIGLGHNVISIALGAKCEKMPFGHNGGNHPVKRLETGRVYITSQGHEYSAVEIPADVTVTYKNINDGSVEGIKHNTLPVFSVQFAPERVAGPLNTGYLFDEFLALTEGGRK